MFENGDIPKTAPHLVNEELRLPSSFRRLCESVTYSNEEIGRIVRCLALGTEKFITPRIEPDVSYYQKVLDKRFDAMERKRRSRLSRMLGGGHLQSSSASEPKAREMDSPVEQAGPADAATSETSDTQEAQSVQPVQEVHEVPDVPKELIEEIVKIAQEGSAGSAETAEPVEPVETVEPAEPAEPVEPVEVIVLPESKARISQPTFIEQQIAVQPKARGSKAASRLSGDLFSLAEEPNKPRRVKSTDNIPTVDSRSDSVWTEQFAIFWKQYPRKVAKEAAKKAFIAAIKKQPDVDSFMAITLASLKWWKEQDGWKKDQGKFIPHPATWLNRGSWGDFKDNVDSQTQAKAEFLRGDAESDEDLIKRMKGG